ncbi:MAG: hypothetical protein ABI573_03280 [Chloroflexota bacterium]
MPTSQSILDENDHEAPDMADGPTDAGESNAKLSDAIARLVDRSGAVLDRAPDVAGGARGALASAQAEVEQLSDMGVATVAAYSLGVTCGLLLAGAPRIILVLSAIPGAMAVRVAFNRGMRPAVLLH